MKEFAQVKSFARIESACVFSFGLLFLIHSISEGSKNWGFEKSGFHCTSKENEKLALVNDDFVTSIRRIDHRPSCNSCFWSWACCQIFLCLERHTNETKGSIQSRIACQTADHCDMSYLPLCQNIFFQNHSYWKCVPPRSSFLCISNSYERFCKMTRFETGSQGNLKMPYWLSFKQTLRKILFCLSLIKPVLPE